MDVIGPFRRFAFGRPHVWIAEGTGGTPARLAVERITRETGWPLATTPLDADVVAVCGDMGGPAAPFFAALVAAVPLPRAVVSVSTESDAAPALTAGREALLRGDGTPGDPEPPGGGQGDPEEWAAAGLPLQDQRPDRDGLTLDVLHVPLGPFLPAWPQGLRLSLTLAGDVVSAAEVDTAVGTSADGEVVAGSWWDAPWRAAAAGRPVTRGTAERRRAAAHLDSLARLCTVAGADGAALAAGRLRDDTLAEGDASTLRGGSAVLRRRLERGGLLARQTDGLGVVDTEAAANSELGGPAERTTADGGDVTARWRRWLAETDEALTGSDDQYLLEPGEGTRGPLVTGSVALARLAADLVVGGDVAGARLIVASLDPDGDDLAAARTLAVPSAREPAGA